MWTLTPHRGHSLCLQSWVENGFLKGKESLELTLAGTVMGDLNQLNDVMLKCGTEGLFLLLFSVPGSQYRAEFTGVPGTAERAEVL